MTSSIILPVVRSFVYSMAYGMGIFVLSRSMWGGICFPLARDALALILLCSYSGFFAAAVLAFHLLFSVFGILRVGRERIWAFSFENLLFQRRLAAPLAFCIFSLDRLLYAAQYAILRKMSAAGDRRPKELSFPRRGRYGFCSLLVALSELEAAFLIARCNRACRTELVPV